MILNSPYISGSLTVTNLSGSGVRYLMTSASGLLISQTADAAIKTTYTASATAGQTVFPVTNGYSTGLVDVYLNGTKLASSDYSDADGVNITLVTGSDAGDLLEFVKYSPALGVTNNALRQLTTFTSSEGQTVYSASYTPGLLDVYYNGSRLTPAEYTANNGTFITLATGSSAGDVIDMLVYSYQVGAFSGVGGGGVANQIAFYNTTSSITGSNSFVVSGSNMGIGTTYPFPNISYAQGLHVSASGNNAFVRVSSGGYTGVDLFQQTDGTSSLWVRDNSPLQVGTNNTFRMIVTNGGNVGINDSTPTKYLTVKDNASTQAMFYGYTTLGARSNNASGEIQIGNNASYNGKIGYSDAGNTVFTIDNTYNSVDAVTQIRMRTAGTAVTAVSIFGTGNVQVGYSGSDFGSRLYVLGGGGQGAGWIQQDSAPPLYLNRTGNDGGEVIFLKAGIQVGYIGTNAYSLPSDLNFKKNIDDLELGLNLITKLRPVSYNHKIDDEDAALSTGFIAQELEQSLTELGIEQNKYYILQHTPNEKEGESQYWLDYQKMIPVLTKAIQEANAKITALEEKLERNNIQ